MMRHALTVSLVTLACLTRQAEAEDFNTCLMSGGLNACASATLGVFDGPSGPVVRVVLTQLSGVPDLRLTAFGFYASPDPGNLLNLGFAPSSWTGQLPAGWTTNPSSRNLANPELGGWAFIGGSFTPVSDFGFGGPLFSDEIFEFDLDGSLPAQLRWVWRGETGNSDLVIDCLQAPEGGETCLSTVPEPSGIALLMTGLIGLAMVGWRTASRQRRSRQE